MSEETTAAPAEAPAPAPIETTEAPAAAPEAAAGLDLAALESATSLPPAAGAEPAPEPTVSIGELQVPRSQLVELLQGENGDEILAAIKRTVKANGEEREVSLLDALEAVPKADGWQRKMYEATQIQQQVREALGGLGRDPLGTIQRIYGVDRRTAAKWMADHSLHQFERENMDPAERAKLEEHEELQRRAAKYEELQAEKEKEALSADTARARATLMPMIQNALKAQGLPATPYQISRLAGIVRSWGEQGIVKGDAQPEHIAEAAAKVKAEYTAERAERYTGLEGDDLLSSIGDDEFVLRVARAVAKRYQRTAARAEAPEGTPGRGPDRTRHPSKIKNMRQWKEDADKRMKRRNRG